MTKYTKHTGDPIEFWIIVAVLWAIVVVVLNIAQWVSL